MSKRILLTTILAISVLLLSLAFVQPGTALAQSSTVTVTIQVNTSGEAPLQGASISYLDGYWKGLGSTNASGQVTTSLPAQSWQFKADYGGTSATLTQDIGVNAIAKFYTSQVIVQINKHDSSALPSAAASYLAGYYRGIGNTDGSGMASTQVFPGSYTFKADYGGTSATQDASVPGDGVSSGSSTTVTFNPTKVTFQYNGNKSYLAGYWRGFSGSIYMFPGTYTFKFDTYQQDITIDGCEVSSSILVIQLKDSAGVGVPGGKAYLGVGGWPYIGDTDSNGVLVYLHDGSLGNMRIRMGAPNCGGSQDSPVQDTTINSVFNFQTSQVVIQLKDSGGTLTNGGVVTAGCGGWPGIGTTGDDGLGTLYHEHFAGSFTYRMGYHGSSMEISQDVSSPFIFQTVKAVIRLEDHNDNPLNGGKVLQGIGGWPQIGVTGDSAPGEVWYELFPGTYAFRLSYNYGTEEKSQDIGSPVVFQTALVNLHFSGTIQHAVGGWPGYTGPTEMLPINQGFGFTACGYPRQVISFTPTAGTIFEKTIVNVILKDSTGAGIAGGEAAYRNGSWENIPGTTAANGSLLTALDGNLGTIWFRMIYAGTSIDKAQNVTTNSCVVFQTTNVIVQLKDSHGTLVDPGTDVQYRNSSWDTFGAGFTTGGQVSMELLPKTYWFRLTYAGTYIDKAQNVASDPIVVFQTVNVTVELRDSSGALMDTGADVQYRNGGWDQFGTGVTSGGQVSMELLPKTYWFRLSYAGTSIDKAQNVSDPNQTVVFQTVNVTVQLQDSGGNPLDSPDVQYRNSNWDTFGAGYTTDGSVSMELLPKTYWFRLTYAGTYIDKAQNVSAPNQTVVFQTVNVTVQLQDSGGNPLESPDVKYRNSDWDTFGVGYTTGSSVSMELLPKTYWFRLTYAGTSIDKAQNVSAPNQTVIFQTVNVTVELRDSGGALLTGGSDVKYRNGDWDVFGGGSMTGGQVAMELLPKTYWFRLTYAGTSIDKAQNVSDPNQTVVFQTGKVVSISNTCTDYRNGSWETFTNDMELLPKTYWFRFSDSTPDTAYAIAAGTTTNIH